MTLKSFIYAVLRVSNDVRAVQRGRIAPRLWNRAVGKIAGRVMK